MKHLTIAVNDELPLPLDTVTQAIALIGQRGVGKTHGLSVLIEELAKQSAPVAVLDPLGVLWGLRSSKNGKGEGLPIVILGGEHGDVPLEHTAGAVIARWVVEERRPCVLDLSGFRKAQQQRFVTEFALELYAVNRQPLMLVVDEADLFIPQRPMPGEQAMLGAFEDIVRRGRARGLGICLATQRPAVIHKDALTQVGALIALRLVGPQDRDAVEQWIKYNADGEGRAEVLASLGSLPVGTAWFWSPGWVKTLKKIRIRDRETFDSSATPKLGDVRIEPKRLAPVELESLRARIADTIERAKATDVKTLQQKVQELTARLERQAVEEAPNFQQEFDSFFHDADRIVVLAEEALLASQKTLDGLRLLRDQLRERRGERPNTPLRLALLESFDAPHVEVVRPPTVRRTGGKSKLGTLGEKILTAAAQIEDLGLEATKQRLGLFVGYNIRSKGFLNKLGELRSAGLLWENDVRITNAGRSELATYDHPLRNNPLAWLIDNKLGNLEANLLATIAARSKAGRPTTKEDLAKELDYNPRSKGFVNALGRLRGLGFVVECDISPAIKAALQKAVRRNGT